MIIKENTNEMVKTKKSEKERAFNLKYPHLKHLPPNHFLRMIIYRKSTSSIRGMKVRKIKIHFLKKIKNLKPAPPLVKIKIRKGTSAPPPSEN
jgi:hypothetical protein